MPVGHTLEIIADSSYVGKVFYCTCKYDGRVVSGSWIISYGDQFASINENGKVTIYEDVLGEDIEITCTYEDSIAVVEINISYDNQLTIECADTITGTSGNAFARYNSTVVTPTWSITSGGAYASIDATGAITITDSGQITLQAVYTTYTTTKTINVVYDAGTTTETTLGDDGSVTTETTTTTTDPETGAVTETTTSQTTNEDGSTSSTSIETTTNEDGSSSTTSTTTNSDGSSSETTSTTSAPDPETGAVTTETSTSTTNADGTSSETTATIVENEDGSSESSSETIHYDENGDVAGSTENTTTVNTDGSSTSQTNNYDENGDPTSTTNNDVDASGNSSTQEIEYDDNGDPVVTEYTIDTSGGSGDGKEIEDGINTEYYAFDTTRGFILDIDFVIDFAHQPANQNENHHNILTAKRASPSPWYGFQIRQSGTNKYVQLGTQFATGNNTNTTISPIGMTNNIAEYILQITYDPTLASNNFICRDLKSGNIVFSASNKFPDIEALKYLKVCLGYAMDENGDPYRYSNIAVKNFSLVKLSNVLSPSISSNGRYIIITTNETGATTYYRLNQSGSFQEYTGQIAMVNDTTVEAYSMLDGFTSVTVSEYCTYTGLKKPTISCDGQLVTITCDTVGASIHYRLNQTGEYIVYNAPITIFEDTIVQAYSELGGDTSETVRVVCVYDDAHNYAEDYLTFKITSNGTVVWKSIGSGMAKTIQYSLNDGAWTDLAATGGGATITVYTGDEIRFKGSNTAYAKDKSNYSGFTGGTATFDIEGNIMSLIHGDNFSGETALTATYAFCSIFKQAAVVNAENLILPATTLTNYCYRAMFSKCPNLVVAPALPATTLTTGVYWYMFEECPITTAPVLNATTLTTECYGHMFTGCGSLNYIKCLATSISASKALEGWVTSVAGVGTFVKADGIAWSTGVAGIPSGWTTYVNGQEPEPEEQDDVWRIGGQSVTLPYSLNAIDGHSSGYAKGTYNFVVTTTLDAVQPTYLQFEHADQSAEIYVNNSLVTTHWGGYNSFTVDITNYIHLGSNKIQVSICNTTRNTLAPCAGDFNFNATLGDVYLVSGAILPDTIYGYDGFWISSVVSDAAAAVTVKTTVASEATVVLTVSDGTYTYTDSQTDTGDITFNFTVNNPHLWNGKSDPYLYDFTLEIYDGQDLCFTSTRPYGFRYYSYVFNNTSVIPGETYTGFLLNGAPYLLRGVCMHQDLEYKANALTSADIAHDFEIIQDLGCNFIRTAHYPHPREFYDWCDELGIVVQTETPWVNKAQSTYPTDYYDHLGSQVRDMVTQHYNHPSIIFWGLANEITTDDKTFAKTKIEGYKAIINTYDTSRYVGYVVSHSYPNGLGTFNDPDVDYIGQNLYVGWYIDTNTNNPSSRINTCLGYANNHNKPMALSEYGCGGTQRCHSVDFMTTTTRGNNPRHDIEYNMWLHEGHIAAIKNYPQLIYTSQWVLFDFAVTSRQEGYTICLDGENTSTNEDLKRLNNKGLVERDHVTKKDTYYLYKAWWNPTSKFVHICGKEFTLITSRQVKCYTNDGDTLDLYINNTLTETAAVSDNIAIFTARTFSSGDVIKVQGATVYDTWTIA